MNPELKLMLLALFPDAVDFQFVPDNWARVWQPAWDGNQFTNYTKSLVKPAPLEFEDIQLEPITEEPPMIYAGMSKKFRIVYIRMEGV